MQDSMADSENTSNYFLPDLANSSFESK